jgi:hypothetical protein
MVSGDVTDVEYEDRDAVDENQLVERAIAALTADSGALRCRHGDRLTILFARGIASIEVSPRGAIL